MVANHDNMLDTFNLCNMEYFGGELMFPEFELLHSKNTCDIMCHEMIHYYLAYTGVDRNCHHGKEFKKMADQLNLNYGLHITKRLDVSKYKKRKRGRVVMSRFSSNNNQVRFFKEAWGFLFEFNSIGEYLSFLLGRVIGVVIFVGILFLFFWLL